MAPARRYELTDEQWDLIKSLMPPRRPGGRWNDHRTTLNGMMWVLKSGSPWRDMPERYGSWKSVYDRFRRWTEDGTIDWRAPSPCSILQQCNCSIPARC